MRSRGPDDIERAIGGVGEDGAVNSVVVVGGIDQSNFVFVRAEGVGSFAFEHVHAMVVIGAIAGSGGVIHVPMVAEEMKFSGPNTGRARRVGVTPDERGLGGL